MFAPRKRKLGDLDVEEVLSTIVPMLGGGGTVQHESGQVAPGAPVVPPNVADVVNMGYGRTMDASTPVGPPSPVPSTPVPTSNAPDTPSPTFGPKVRSRQDVLNEEYQRNDELNKTGVPKEHSVAKRLLQGALRGLATGGIGGAITGAAMEGFYPKANTEQNTKTAIAKSNQRIGGLQKAVDAETGTAYKNTQMTNVYNTIANRNAQTVLDMDKATRAQLNDEQANILKVWADLDEFDPNDQKNAPLIQRAKAAKIDFLVPKVKGQRYSTQISPDGRIVVTNTSTGKYEIGKEVLAKPPTITANELPDSLFGIDDDKTINDRAVASVGAIPPGAQVKPAMLAALEQDPDVKDEYGQINMPKVLAKYDPQEVYENLPSDYAQRVAKAKTGLSTPQWKRQAVDRFKLALTNNSPSPNARPVPIETVTADFNAILAIPDKKKRETALSAYYRDILPNIRIGR